MATLTPQQRRRERLPRTRHPLDDPGFARTLDDLLAQYRATILPNAYELDQRARINAADIAAALALWDANTSENAPSLTVPTQSDRIKPALLVFLAYLTGHMATNAKDYRNGTALNVWLDRHLALIKHGSVVAGLAAYNGKDNLQQYGLDRTGQVARRQYDYAERMATDILDGKQRQNGRLDARAALYAGVAWTGYQALRRRLQSDAVGGLLSASVAVSLGVDPEERYERNVQNSMEGCSQCESETQEGWVPVGTLSSPGTRECLSFCKCDISYGSDPNAP
jgi:hypothetical protein